MVLATLLGANSVIYQMPGMNTITDEALRSIIHKAPGIPERYLPPPSLEQKAVGGSITKQSRMV